MNHALGPAAATGTPAAPHPLSYAVLHALRGAGLDIHDVQRVVATALAEDLRHGPDTTTQACVPAGAVGTAVISPRSPGVLAGVPIALAVFDAVLGPTGYEVLTVRTDGTPLLAPGLVALRLRGPVRGLLTAERTALNLLCHLSGIATTTARWVHAVRGTGCAIRDTRKTLPGLRLLAKYAVRCGGGLNHRLSLGDAILIKDNHIAAAGSVTAAISQARAHAPDLPCEVEVTSLAELDEAVAAGATEILLDNMTPTLCATAVRYVRSSGAAVRLEASGGITLDLARAYADTGVDYLAIGAITHSAPALDLGLDLSR